MFESLFGADMPAAARFFLAFLVVLGLIGVTAWAVRRFGSGRLGSGGPRGRQPRLAVIDYASIDARRRLILVRRDNIEHLLMIGGPTDLVVEPNIVRAMAPPREVNVGRPPNAVESLPRAIPLPENSGSWPLQPEPPRPPARSITGADEPPVWPLQPNGDLPKRAQRDTLAALADELGARPPARNRSAGNPRVQPAEPKAEPRAEQLSEPVGEPVLESHAEPRVEPRIPATADPAESAAADQSLAEMAQRLEAALRKPASSSEARAPAPTSRAAPPNDITATPVQSVAAPPASPVAPRSARSAEPKLPRSDAKPTPSKTLYDSLEQEMASLLGRPTNKT